NNSSNNTTLTVVLNPGCFASGTTTLNTDVSGKATFNNLVINQAGNNTMTASASGIGTGLSGATSSSFIISAGSFAKLQLLVPGETAAPGTGSGKTGAPSIQSSNVVFAVTVNGVDANWNVSNTNDTI